MELRVLKYFLTVADEGNITRAADILHVTQPTLSRQLMELEDEMGTSLLIRGKRSVTYIYRSEGCRMRHDPDRRHGSGGRQDAGSAHERIQGEISGRSV